MCQALLTISDDIKNIYKIRWSIETSFRELKYHVGLIAFQSCDISDFSNELGTENFSNAVQIHNEIVNKTWHINRKDYEVKQR